MIEQLFARDIHISSNLISFSERSEEVNQQQTNEVFSEKWEKVATNEGETDDLEDFQLKWYLQLYGFESNEAFEAFLKNKKVIIDAGCGLGYKAAWMARLSPESTVIGIDYSSAVDIASEKYKGLKNLFFIRGDIADTGIQPESVDYISCDQVIMHTEEPQNTFAHLSGLLKPGGEFACYVYAKKALPRELLEDYFRQHTHKVPTSELWEMSEQLVQLGKTLSDLNIKIEVPDIPLMGIKGGEYDLQRFFYWNFIKCFYKEDWNWQLNVSTNFDWYSPSNARRYHAEEFYNWAKESHLEIVFRHTEEACHTGRFKK